MKTETIERFWRVVYSNSHEEPFCRSRPQDWLEFTEVGKLYSCVRIIWRFYWVKQIIK